MTVGLIDVDGRVMRGNSSSGTRYPNLALMKWAAWHRRRGDSVEFAFPLKRYDEVHISKVFTFSPDLNYEPKADRVDRGGTGYGLDNRLPDEVEHIMPDYSLYGVKDTAYGFLTRGCPRGCPFCIVAEKEGRASRKVADLREWWDGQRHIKLMDPNIIACPNWRDLLGQLAESGAWVDFSQGIDIRLLNDDKVSALNAVKTKMVHFAWDGNEDLEPLFRKFAPLLRVKDKRRRSVYVLTNYNTTHEYDLHRIYTLADCGFDPFVMVYDKDHAPPLTRKVARWCNNKAVFRKVTDFKDYKEGTTK